MARRRERRPPDPLGHPRRGGARRGGRLRLLLGDRAPLLRGDRPQLGARGVPGGARGPDDPDPPGPRRRGAPLQPSGARRRARGHARHPLQRAPGSRHGPGRLLVSHRGLRRPDRPVAGGLGRGAPGRSARSSSNDTFPGHKGRHYEIPERKLVPKPVQRPHPPLWVAATSQATFASAARAGLGVLGFTAVPPEELAPAVAAYRADQAGADPSGLLRDRAQLPGRRVHDRALRRRRPTRARHRGRRRALVPRGQRGAAEPRALRSRFRPRPLRQVHGRRARSRPDGRRGRPGHVLPRHRVLGGSRRRPAHPHGPGRPHRATTT